MAPDRGREASDGDAEPPAPPGLAPGNAATVGTGLRVATVGPSVLAAAVRELPVEHGVLQPSGPHGPRHVDALLLEGADSGTLDAAQLEAPAPVSGSRSESRAEARAVRTQAEREGIPILRHLVGPSELADVVEGQPTGASGRVPGDGGTTPYVVVGAGAEDGPWPRPSVDTSRVNPIGVRWAASGPLAFAAFAPGGRWGRGLEAIRAAAGAAPLAAVVAASGSRGGTPANVAVAGEEVSSELRIVRVQDDPARMVAALRRHTGVIDHPDLHRDAVARADWLAVLGCAGVPLVALELQEAVLARLGPRFSETLASASLEDLASPSARDHLGVRQRRAALGEHGVEHAWRAIAHHLDLTPAKVPTVSAVLATHRPDHLHAAVARFGAFRYPSRELVVALHGDGFPAGDPATTLSRMADAPVTVLQVPSRRRLGEVLNAAVEAASGELITKLDDDDLYDADHLDDLVEALRYSGATLVGKGSEFVHLGEIDLTIRRLPKGAESRSRTIAGGTLMMGREDLRRVGGWQRAARSVDQLLMDDVVSAGGTIHRTHPYGFVLDRHGRGHTWDTPTDYFLRQAVEQWPGLALEAAGFTAPDPGARFAPRDSATPSTAPHAGARFAPPDPDATSTTPEPGARPADADAGRPSGRGPGGSR